MQHHSGNSCNIISARRIGLASALDYAGAVERVRVINAQSLPHYKFHSLQVLWRRENNEAAGEDALRAVVRDLHTGGSGYMDALPSQHIYTYYIHNIYI